MDRCDPPDSGQLNPITGTDNITAITADDPLNNPFGTLNDLCHDLSILQDLACRGAWRSILDKVALARSHSLLSEPHERLTYLTFNVLSLTKLRRCADALAELDVLDNDLDSFKYRYESYPHLYPNRTGSMVPFALRWLHAELPSKLGKLPETLDRLYTLLDFARSKYDGSFVENSSASTELWKKREIFVMNTIIGHHLTRKDFNLCLDLLTDLINRHETVDPVLLSKLGYIQMQYGDLEGAKRTFGLIEDFVKKEMNGKVELVNLVSRNKALMYLVAKDYVSAVREYDQCIERDGNDVVAVNNKALCLMYLRDLSDSIKVLESALERIPTIALNETIVVNLCSMYELAYVNHSDVKRTLSSWITRIAPDDFDSSCTRI